MSFEFHYFQKDADNDSFEHVKGLTLAAMLSLPKYSDYSEEQVNKAFDDATDMIFATNKTSSPLFKVPLGFILMKNHTIILMFTLPGGKNKNLTIYLVKEAIKFLRQKDYDEIFCETCGFNWTTSAATFHQFTQLEKSLYHTYVLRFNQKIPEVHEQVPFWINATEADFKEEPLIEKANYEYVKANGGKLLKELLNQNLLTEDELARARFDVRGGLLRPGQSNNPLGLHCDFSKLGSKNRLKILFISNGYSETRIYTQPVTMTHHTIDDWYKIVRDPAIDNPEFRKNFMSVPACQPVIFSDLDIHEAKSLQKSGLPPGKDAVYRLLARIVVYPESRSVEIPISGGPSNGQVYMESAQEM